MTAEKFNAWRKQFTAELRAKREREEEERVKGLTPKEREDYRKKKERPTGKSIILRYRLVWSVLISGRELFETTKSLATSDEGLYEEGGVEVDVSKYSREEREAERRKEEEEEEKRRRGLVDGNESD